MANFCGYRRRGGGTRALGALLFLIFVPRWVWTSALGIVLISVGYLLWRFGE